MALAHPVSRFLMLARKLAALLWCLGLPLLALADSSVSNTSFSDNFDGGASPAWSNTRGDYQVVNGTYTVGENHVQDPLNFSGLPYDLTDFNVDVDVTPVGDGGIWIHADAKGLNGLLLVIGGNGYANGGPGGSAGTSLYFHVVKNGQPGPILGEVTGVFTQPGVESAHIRVEVAGNVTNVFVNGSATPTATLTDDTYTHGRPGLYGTLGSPFDNFVLEVLPALPAPIPPPEPLPPIRADFSDNFDDGVSPLWSNTRGDYEVVNGTYTVNEDNIDDPVNFSGLPYDLTDFIAEVDVNKVSDGGVWIHADSTGQNGLLLVVGGNGWAAAHGNVVSAGSVGNTTWVGQSGAGGPSYNGGGGAITYILGGGGVGGSLTLDTNSYSSSNSFTYLDQNAVNNFILSHTDGFSFNVTGNVVGRGLGLRLLGVPGGVSPFNGTLTAGDGGVLTLGGLVGSSSPSTDDDTLGLQAPDAAVVGEDPYTWPGGTPGHLLYFQIVKDGHVQPVIADAGDIFSEPGVENAHLRIEVHGNVTSVYVNGASDPAVTVTDDTFTHGEVGLYGFTGTSFDNFVLQDLSVPDPGINPDPTTDPTFDPRIVYMTGGSKLPDSSASLTGSARGSYTRTTANPDTGSIFKFTGAGTLAKLGGATVTGNLHTPGFIVGGNARGTLTLKNAKGQAVLTLNGAWPQSFTGKAVTLSYTVQSAKGTFKGLSKTGKIRLTLTTKPNSFKLVFVAGK